MQTGTALFFGLVLVAIVILYHSTKDRWNWQKIIKKTLLIPVGLLGLGLLIWIFFAVKEKIGNMPTKQIELSGVKIGELRRDVLFNKGAAQYVYTTEQLDAEIKKRQNSKLQQFREKYPEYNDLSDQELADALYKKYYSSMSKKDFYKKVGLLEFYSKLSNQKNSSVDATSDLPEGFVLDSQIKKEDTGNLDALQYENLQIFFKDDKVSYVIKICRDLYEYSSVNGVSCGSNLEDMESKLGKAEAIRCSKDALTRIYYYPKYQTAYALTTNSITDFAIYDSSLGKSLNNGEGFYDCTTKN